MAELLFLIIVQVVCRLPTLSLGRFSQILVAYEELVYSFDDIIFRIYFIHECDHFFSDPIVVPCCAA